MEGEGAGELALDESNLVDPRRPGARRARRRPARTPACTCASRSRSPAGLAGGSADAAAALVACDALWGTGLSPRRAGRASPPSSAPTCRSWCSAAPRSAPAGASRSARCWPAPTPGTGWSRSPTAACPRPRSTASSTGCARAGAAPPPLGSADDAARRAAPARPRGARRARSPTTCRPAALSLRPAAAPTRSTPGCDAGRARRPGLRFRPDLRVPGRRRRAHARAAIGRRALRGRRGVLPRRARSAPTGPGRRERGSV